MQAEALTVMSVVQLQLSTHNPEEDSMPGGIDMHITLDIASSFISSGVYTLYGHMRRIFSIDYRVLRCHG